MGATVDVRRKPESDGIGRPVLHLFGRGGAEHLRPARPNGSIMGISSLEERAVTGPKKVCYCATYYNITPSILGAGVE